MQIPDSLQGMSAGVLGGHNRCLKAQHGKVTAKGNWGCK